MRIHTREADRAQVQVRTRVLGIFFELVAKGRFFEFKPAIAGTRRQHLQPQVAHFVADFVPGPNALRRIVRIPRIRGRIVVVKTHRNHRVFRQKHRVLVAIHGFPVAIPVGDADQPFTPAGRVPLRGRRRIGFKNMTQIVRVRIHGEHINIHRKLEIVRNQKIADARRNVQGAVVLKLKQHRKPLARLVGEIQADRRPNLLRLSARLHVRVEHQIASRIEPPRHSVRLGIRNAPRLPIQKCAVVGIVNAALDHGVHAGEPRAGRDLLCARRACAIHVQIGVMHQALVAGTNLDGANPARGGNVRGENEVPVKVGLALRERRGHRVRPLRFKNQIGRPKLPSFGEVGRRRVFAGCLWRRSFWRPRGGPIGDQLNLFGGEAALVLELAIARLGKPRRHEAAARYVHDLCRVRFDVAIGEQRERARFAGTMAGRAVLRNDGRDIVRESRGRRKRKTKKGGHESTRINTNKRAPYSCEFVCIRG